jgi:hypothetical protein
VKRWAYAVGAAGLVLAGCGGDGGSSPPISVIPGGPSPTPTPSSSPTATPTPSASYQTYAQLTGNQSFQTACAALNFSNGNPPAPQPATNFGDGLTLAYTAATDSYTISGDGLSLSYAPAQLDPAAPAGVRGYLRTENGFTQRFSIGTPAPGGVALDYVRAFSLRALRNGQTLQYQCVFGVPTRLTDPPDATTVTFTRVGINGAAYVAPVGGGLQTYALTASTATLSVNVATGEATTVLRLVGTLQTASGPASTTTELGTFTGVGDFDDTRPSFYGPLTSTDRDSQFSFFGGWFFGPQGREAAFSTQILAVDRTTGARMSVLANVFAAR